MLPPVLSKWKINEITENILFFAQMLEELLFNFSPDEYRLQAVNSRILCAEALEVLAAAEAGRLAEEDIRPVMEELAESLDQDPAAAALLADDLRRDADLAGPGTRLKSVSSLLESGYFRTNRDLLKESVLRREPGKIVRLTRDFLAELVDRGFSPEFIFFETKNYFFEGDVPALIEGVEALEGFFARFSGSRRSWTAVFRIGRDVKRIRNFSTEVQISITTDKPVLKLPEKSENIDQFLVKNNRLPYYLIIRKIPACDPFSARHLAEEHLWTIDSFVRYHIHRKNFEWSSAALIQDAETSQAGIYGHPVPALLKRPDPGPGPLHHFMTDTAAGLFTEMLDGTSRKRLGQAFQRHNMAARAAMAESQLLELWSAVEILFSGDTRRKDKAAFISDILAAYAIRGYAAKQAADLVKSIRVSNCPEAIILLDGIPGGGNAIERCLLLLTSQDKEDRRRDLVRALGNHVLLKCRFRAIAESFGNAGAIHGTLCTHRRRAVWQLRRIYRARRLILDSGESPAGIHLLVENLHSCLDRAMDVLLDEIVRRRKIINIDEIHHEVVQRNRDHLAMLEKSPDECCNGDNFRHLLFGM